jgi:phytoene dehydrogenase-like protein
MFARGHACLPRGGMEAIPAQLAAGLPSGSVRLETPVERVEPGRVHLTGGRKLEARHVIVATDGPAAAELLPEPRRSAVPSRRWKGTRLVAFAADSSPLERPELVVSADADGPIDNLTVPSDVVAGYAPSGAALVFASIRADFSADGEELVDAVRRQAAAWFGGRATHWRHLRTVRVARALPDESPAGRRLRPAAARLDPGLFICGDHCGSASINGALSSGRHCAEAVLAERA